MTDPKWQPPGVETSDLAYLVTSSVLEQFAQGHGIADVLRELVQNEYDAGGRSLTVAFGSDGLDVRGTGAMIDADGWRRLSVMLGTGRVVGDDHHVPRKGNGIGSKNHGLRSLFLLGDRIYVRSGGRQSLLDLDKGTLREPIADPASAGVPGAHIHVPYREHARDVLEPYDATRQARDVSVLAEQLGPTLIKLAHPRAPRSLRAVTVTSAASGRALEWKQDVREIGRHQLRGPILRRTIELRDGELAGSPPPVMVREHEYQRTLPIPPQHRGRSFPSYFRVRGGRVRIGISLGLRRGRPEVTSGGNFYYPLGFAHSATGTALSVSAPFDMNGDRSALVESDVSAWNGWLLAAAADFALELLTRDWLDAFGPAVYTALTSVGQPAVPDFAALVEQGLRERECWPTRERTSGSRRPNFVVASELTPGVSAELDVLLGDERRLDARFAGPRIQGMARAAGAKPFTVASAVRLRCAGQDVSKLKTKVGSDANLAYPGFPGVLASVERQERFAAAFEAHRRQLTRDNRADLAHTATTLTAAETLEAPDAPLWIVDGTLEAMAPVAPAHRLHSALGRYRVMRGLCKPFDTSQWARDVAQRVTGSVTADEERDALYAVLLREPESIRRNVWPALRGAPVVRDHRGEWAQPDELISRGAAGVGRLEASLRFPAPEIARNHALVRRLRIRSKLTGADLVGHARLVVERPELAEQFLEELHRAGRLLTPKTISVLRSIQFIPTSGGDLVIPRGSYVRSAHLLACLGETAPYVTGTHSALYARLGCRTEPEAPDVVGYLESLREADRGGPPKPEILYPALARALRSGGGAASVEGEPIVFHEGGWYPPMAALLSTAQYQFLSAAVPVLRAGGDLRRAYAYLGVDSEPATAHWLRFFAWVDELSDRGERRLASRELAVVRKGYLALGKLPSDVPRRARVFADTTGGLHSVIDVAAKRYLINDDPPTAEAAIARQLPVAFADVPDQRVRRFLLASGVLPLTEARGTARIRVGPARPGPKWFRAEPELARLHRLDFISAAHAAAIAGGSSTAATKRLLRRRLHAVKRVELVEHLVEVFSLGRHEFEVEAEVAVNGDRIVLRQVRGKSELRGLLARAVARIAEDTPAMQHPLTDSIYRLLACESADEIKRYLEQRGISWNSEATSSSLFDEPEEPAEPQDLEEVKHQLLNSIGTRAPSQGGSPPGPDTPVPPAEEDPVAPTPRQLPPLEAVQLVEAEPTDWVLGDPEPRRRRGPRGGWRPRTPGEQDDDKRLGDRGEELIYCAEVARVKALGLPDSRVVWTSKTNATADHDIKSVGPDGEDLWIEVKSTTGMHGRFDWPRAEFELALQERTRYLLCRVYQADTTSPSVLRLPDPVGKLLGGDMRLDIATLTAEIAPLDSSE